MPTAGRLRAKYAKQLGRKLAAGGDMVSDVEAQQMEQAMVEAAGAGLKAQQMNLGQAAKAAGVGGPFMEQQFQKSQQDIAKQQAETAVKASGQQKLLEAQLQDTRRQMASQEIGAVQAHRQRNVQLGIDTVRAATDVAKVLLTGPASQLQEAGQRTVESAAKGAGAALKNVFKKKNKGGDTPALKTAADAVGAGKTNAEFAADIERQLEEVAAGQRQMSAEVKAFYEATLEQLKNQE
jgi:hypothetical protein